MHHLVQTDRKLAVIPKAPIRTAALVRMLPCVTNNLSIGGWYFVFDEA